MPYSYGLRGSIPALNEQALLSVREKLRTLDEALTLTCLDTSRSPREVSIIRGLLADVWECWRSVESGERIGVATISQLIERLGKKSKCPQVLKYVEATNASLRDLLLSSSIK